jgi:hypothetical protein
MAGNVEKMIAATRKDATKLAKAVRDDVAEFGSAVTTSSTRSRAKASGTRARGTATRRKSTTAKTAAARR